eukprot:6440318-Pyramimonas_sp.AAC.1
MRPKWLKVDAGSANISVVFQDAMDRDGTIIVDTAGTAKEQNGKAEVHGKWFEEMLQAMLDELQPQDEEEWLEC